MAVIYRINCPNNRIYIGSAFNFKKRKQRHLSSLKCHTHHNDFLQKIYDVYGKDSLVFEIIEECTKENIKEREEFHIFNADRKSLINLLMASTFGDTLSNNPNKKEIIEKRSASLYKKLATMSQEEKNETWGRKGNQNGSYGKKHLESTKLKCSIKGKIGAATRTKQMIGKTYGEIYGEKEIIIKEKLSATLKEKQKGEGNNFYGKKHSDKSKLLIAEQKKGKFTKSQCKPIEILGLYYRSAGEAALLTGMNAATIRFRVLSKTKEFENYKFITDKDLIETLLSKGF